MDAGHPPMPPPYVEVFRDDRGHKVGKTEKRDGVEKIYDEKNHYRGQYRDGDGKTRDRAGHIVGTGDQNTRNLEK